MQAKSGAAVVWFRRDLRMDDHAALYHALQASPAVYAVFVFDTEILQTLPRQDKRVNFIWQSCVQLHAALAARGGKLHVRVGNPITEIPTFVQRVGASAVYTNRDYEPLACARDQAVEAALLQAGCQFYTFKDQVIFEKDDLLTQQGKPYTVFTPYSRKWRSALTVVQAYPVATYAAHLARCEGDDLPTLAQLGFDEVDLHAGRVYPGIEGADRLFADFVHRIDAYREKRDFPAQKGPSYLSVHLRFGTISVRQLVAFALAQQNAGADTWLNELIWREFYQQLLWHFPHVANEAFKAAYIDLPFPNRMDWFAAWCEARTGYPLVDAAMRQLNQTGYMHNRLRMIVASFLVKDLLIDWRLGAEYFALHLLDFDLAANNGGWQWAASTGCDAQPYFRIFNPITQSQKFDASGHFIRRYVPELAALPTAALHAPWLAKPEILAAAQVQLGLHYPLPIVDHAVQRQEALQLFAKE